MTQEQNTNIRIGLGKFANEARFVGRRGKTPINPHAGYGAKANDPSTWGSLDQALKAVDTYSLDGIGVELGNGLCGIDLDHCFDEFGIVLADWAIDIIKSMDSYTEISPSGTGIHILFSGCIPGGNRRKNGVEMYSEGRYFTLTGDIYTSNTVVEPRTEQAKALHIKYIQGEETKPLPQATVNNIPQSGPDYLSVGLQRDSLLLSMWNGLRHYSDESANDMAFMDKLAYWCNGNVEQMINAFRSSPYAQQKDPKHKVKMARDDYMRITAHEAVVDLQRTAVNDNSAYKNSQAKKEFSGPDSKNKCSSSKEPETNIICLDDIETEDVKWIWKPYIPLGKLTLVQGDPGDGKTTFVLNVASIISRGDSFPGEFPIDPGNIIYQTAEDGIADTIKPRLLTAEADCSRIFIIDESQQSLSLSDERIESAMKQLRPKLFIIDPLQAYLGADVDMHRANEVRPILKKISLLAEKYACAVIMVMHLSKASQSRSLYRGLGTIDIPAAARSVLLVGKNPNNPQERAIAHVKSSLAPTGKSIAFEINPDLGFCWRGDSNLTADDMLAGRTVSATEETKSEEAVDFIESILVENAEVDSRDVYKAAKAAGIKTRTLERARDELKAKNTLKIERKGFGPSGRWIWKLIMENPFVEQ